jgi:hypothetical protein
MYSRSTETLWVNPCVSSVFKYSSTAGADAQEF